MLILESGILFVAVPSTARQTDKGNASEWSCCHAMLLGAFEGLS
jgi:hypothetical protein